MTHVIMGSLYLRASRGIKKKSILLQIRLQTKVLSRKKDQCTIILKKNV